jgi:hypothetical protein
MAESGGLSPKKGVSVATVGPTPHNGQVGDNREMKYDPSDYILDKIDYEFYNSARVSLLFIIALY